MSTTGRHQVVAGLGWRLRSAVLMAGVVTSLFATPATADEPGTQESSGKLPKVALGSRVGAVLLGGLGTLALEARSSTPRPPAGMITRTRSGRSEVAISLEIDPERSGAVRAAIRAARGAVLHTGEGVIEAFLPTKALEGIAALDGVERVRPIRERLPGGWVTPATAIHGAPAWHAAGIDGTGIRIGVIDLGFDGIRELLGTEIPSTVVARCYREPGTFTSDLEACESGTGHGTAVAELVVDMAPGAQLYVANPITPYEYRDVIRWMTSEGVRVINASTSSGYLFDGPGDGTAGRELSTYEEVDLAVALGALWLNAAGNEGTSGWIGDWVDEDNDRDLDFAPDDDTNAFELEAGQYVRVALRWPDTWGEAEHDYDIRLWHGDDTVAGSVDGQGGYGDPFEIFDFIAPEAGRYHLTVRKYAADPVPDLQILIYSTGELTLEHAVPDSTLPSPADSANPGMLTIGALQLDHPDQIEAYSGRGPTLDGRVKPDLVAVNCMGTLTYGQFCGTSASTPMAAGAAVLALQANPELGPEELAAYLNGRALPLGPEGPDNIFGFGRLELGRAGTVPQTSPAVVIETSARSMTWPDAVRLTAQVTPAPRGGHRVHFQGSRDGSEWIGVGSALTDASGRAVLTLTPIATRRYRAVALGTSTTSEALEVAVRKRLTLRPSIAVAGPGQPVRAIDAGTAVTFEATVRPIVPDEGRPLVDFTVYRRVDSAWRLHRTVRLAMDDDGRVRMRWQFDLPGQWYVRAHAPATPGSLASVPSAVLRYDVVSTTPGTLHRAWRARADGIIADLLAYAAGPGVIEVSLTGLPRAARVTARIQAGTCATPGATVASLPGFAVDGDGAVDRRLALSSATVRAITAAGSMGGAIAVELRSGAARRCAPLRAHPVAVATIPTVGEATAIGSDGESVWVVEGMFRPGAVSRIEPSTNVTVERNQSSFFAFASGAAADRDHVFVSQARGGLVWLDRRTGEDDRLGFLAGGGEVALCGESLWAVNTTLESVDRFNAATGEFVAEIEVGADPFGVACTAGEVWVTNTGDGTVSRIDPETDEVVATIPVPGAHRVTAHDGVVWVSVRPSRAASGAIVRIDTATNTIAARVSVGTDPAGMVIVGDTVYVAMAGEPTLIQVRADSVTARIGLPAKATGIVAAAGSIWLLHPRLTSDPGSALDAGGVSRLNV